MDTQVEIDDQSVDYLIQHWGEFGHDERLAHFHRINRADAEDLFLSLKPEEQVELLRDLPINARRTFLRILPIDDVTSVIRIFEMDERRESLQQLDSQSQREVMGLLAFADDEAGGLINPRFIRLRPDITADVAIRYLRSQARTPIESVYYAYVLDDHQKLLGVISFRDLLLAGPDTLVSQIMQKEVVFVPEDMDQEKVSSIFSKYKYTTIPVVDSDERMIGVVAADDIIEAVQEEATEDMQKIGGMEALDAPYMNSSFFGMIKKRLGWLVVLFFGEMLTASAMARYEGELDKALVLALFIPLIISSGGNSGSQASTLIVRALALEEVRLKDWFRVLFRETGAGLLMGFTLALVGFFRIVVWQQFDPIYGDKYIYLGLTVSISLIGVVLWGTITGSMLPFILRIAKLDPASASAPLVATLVDVTGLVIYFTVANLMLIH